jgi:formylglycine-generating enzyme required for sulfatase activity
LVGVPDRKEFYEPDPYGMTYIPMGSFTMGPNDEDVAFAIIAQAKTVSIDPFWMDITEITNNEYSTNPNAQGGTTWLSGSKFTDFSFPR